MTPGAVVLVACHDLMFLSKIEATLRHMGLAPLSLRPTDEPAAIIQAARPAGLIVDLAAGADRWRAVVAAARSTRPGTPILAFGPHVDRDLQGAAKAEGCTLVVANSRFARDLPALVERLLLANDQP